tara:strand:+ start:361 stop:543 length:183 start_codon:yes stop_codon:yes gene_type:complete
MIITNAQYLKSFTNEGTIRCIKCEIDGVVSYVPISKLGNSDYAEILKQVKEGKLTIKDAD